MNARNALVIAASLGLAFAAQASFAASTSYHVTQAQIDQMMVDDLQPSEWRLACQMVLRDEDIIVEYPSR